MNEVRMNTTGLRRQAADPRRWVWYASYGSNLNYQRFMCYIKGDVPQWRTEPNQGCRDKTPPQKKRPIQLNFVLYFAGRATSWNNGGAAFIRQDGDESRVLGRMYLITDDQFNDIVMQENSRKVDGSRFVPPFDILSQRRESLLPGKPWYGRLLNVGVEQGHPILTFTTNRTDLRLNSPSENYVKTIASGLKETYPSMKVPEIFSYLSRAEGIAGRLDPRRLEEWVKQA